MNTRFTKEQLKIVRNNPEMHYHVLDQLGGALLLESFFSMYRKCVERRSENRPPEWQEKEKN